MCNFEKIFFFCQKLVCKIEPIAIEWKREKILKTMRELRIINYTELNWSRVIKHIVLIVNIFIIEPIYNKTTKCICIYCAAVHSKC